MQGCPRDFFQTTIRVRRRFRATALNCSTSCLTNVFRRSAGKVAIETNHEQMRDTKIANQRDLVLRRGEQVRRVLRPQHFRGMRIECDNDRRPVRLFRMFGRCADDGLMTKVDAIKNPDCEKQRAF